MRTTTVGRRVKWARRRAGLTQHGLAEAAGLPQPSVARIERGTVIPRTATLIALLAAAGHRLAVEPIGPAVDREAIQRRLAMNVPQRTRKALGRAAGSRMTSPARILRLMRRFGVPFVLVGDLAEAVHGSPMTVGRAIEVCHPPTDVAEERLALAMKTFGTPPAKAGPVRLLTESAAGDDYEVLARNAVSLPVEAGILIPVACLEDLIRAREARCTPEDREAAAVLRAVEEESQLR